MNLNRTRLLKKYYHKNLLKVPELQGIKETVLKLYNFQSCLVINILLV